MPFIPHTEEDVRAMCAAIGVGRIEELFDEIPEALKSDGLAAIPAGMSEMEVARLMQQRAQADAPYLNFIGAGAYEHHIPAAVWQIATRGEFYSAYTPYQAEASQGTLQVLYEFQSMMAALTGLDATNASLYDGASALAEAVLMAVRLHKSSRRVLLPAGLNPSYRRVVASIVSNQRIQLIDMPYSVEHGGTVIDASMADGQDFAALVIPQPNYFGVIEDVDRLTDWAHAYGALVIACVNPTALALLKPPGQWGGRGADIAVGEGQPLGVPMANGGPYFGFMACRQALVRQMPGRIVGRTLDADGRPGFTLTLQAREQHIRRSKATSNICTNQGLAVTAATIFMAMLGATGLRNVAARSHANLLALLGLVTGIDGVRQVFFSAPHFHEAVICLPQSVSAVLEGMLARGILGGLDLTGDYPELGNTMLVCTTETKTQADLEAFASALAETLAAG